MPDDDRTTGRHQQHQRYPQVAGFSPRTRSERRRRTAAVTASGLFDPGTRRTADWAVPAAVILAGVLVVVGVGFAVSRAATASKEGTVVVEEPAAQPPLLGNLPAEPTDRFPIPLESASPLPTTPATTPPTSKPTTKLPTTTEPPVFTGTVAIARGSVPAAVSLPAEGTRDWVHWGEQGTFSLERKADGGFAILEGAPTAPRVRFVFSPQKFSWQDGNPVASSTGTSTGIRTCGKGNGFTLSAPAGSTGRTLTLYVGAVAARGKLTAKLTSGDASASATFTQETNSLATTRFTVSYRAPSDGKITLTWVTDDSFDDDCGGVALEAATLR